ncbi:MAG: FG-GAP repeat domain-containing protein [Mangrovibacterium sp.]
MKKILFFSAFLTVFLFHVTTGNSGWKFASSTTGKNTATVSLIAKSKVKGNLLFRHSTFNDFSGGTVSNSGNNLFVSHDGQIRFVNWFDLNNDGYSEIVSVNDHNPYETSDGFIYYNRPGRGIRSLMPPVHEFIPGFQRLEWMEESLKQMDRLPSLGGGTTLASDLNGDGYPEILFTNFVHGWSDNHFPVSLYWGGENGFSRSRVSYLPSLTASGLAVADLDGSGHKDIIVANVGREAFSSVNVSAYSAPKEGQAKRVVEPEEGTSYIYWQEAWGFSTENRSELPTEYALDVSVADLNMDGYPDVVFLQAGSPGSVRIFYGGQGGVDVNKHTDIKALAPVWGTIIRKLLVADLNRDGRPDIFVPSLGDVSEIFWNGPDGFNQEKRILIPARNAMAGAAEDLNGNGYNDLVIVNENGPSYVYWGGADGFSADNRTELPTNIASGVAIADLNNDGFFDIVFSNSQKGELYDTSSFIYWGSKDGYHPADRDDFWGFGAVDVAVSDFNKDGYNDIFLMNRQSGTRSPQYGTDTYNPVDLFVLWGNERSRYSEASMSALPGAAAQSSALATDIDGNGYADLVYLTNRGKTVNVFLGDQEGYSPDKRRQYDIFIRGRTPLTADLNKDGYLDIIVESSEKNEIAVLLGNQTGFEKARIDDLGTSTTRLRTESIGDIDGDGNLDLLFGGHGFIKILHGTGKGSFDIKGMVTVETGMYTTKISLADFNGDGLLDIFGHHHTPSQRGGEYSVYSAIYWNDKGSFSGNNRFEFPTHGAHSGSVADVDNDGNLDILIANYNSQNNRNLETFIYWGGPEGSFSVDSVTRLPGYSPVANLVLDLNGDSINDIVVYNHSQSTRYAGLNPLGGMHGTQSYIYWGTEKGWHPGKRDKIPSVGPHGRLDAEPGDLMRRRPFEEYTSAPVHIKDARGRYNLKVESKYNFRQNISVFIKSADSSAELEKTSWKEIDLEERSSDFFLYKGTFGRDDLFIQYKLRLDTGGTGTGPVVTSVEMFK